MYEFVYPSCSLPFIPPQVGHTACWGPAAKTHHLPDCRPQDSGTIEVEPFLTVQTAPWEQAALWRYPDDVVGSDVERERDRETEAEELRWENMRSFLAWYIISEILKFIGQRDLEIIWRCVLFLFADGKTVVTNPGFHRYCVAEAAQRQ